MEVHIKECQTVNGSLCNCFHAAYAWSYAIKTLLACIVIAGNTIVLVAILQNWKTLIRQHNIYRYVLSLVAADLLNGFTLLVYAVFQIATSITGSEIDNENFQEVLRNLIIGVLHGLAFASLASTSLLNLVLRIRSTRALARAAAITAHSYFTSWIRRPRITIVIISLIWIITFTFVIIPLLDHCHIDITQCFNSTTLTRTFFVTVNGSMVDIANHTNAFDCSILRPPAKRSYLLVLNSFVTSAWTLLIMCNIYTICIITTVQKAPACIPGKNNLTFKQSFGIAWDKSSFFACIISVSITISTLPFVIFTFVTESGSPQDRIYYGQTISNDLNEFIEMTKYFSSAVNPIIYTAMFSRLRSDITRILDRRKKAVYLTSQESNSERRCSSGQKKQSLTEMQCVKCFDQSNLP